MTFSRGVTTSYSPQPVPAFIRTIDPEQRNHWKRLQAVENADGFMLARVTSATSAADPTPPT